MGSSRSTGTSRSSRRAIASAIAAARCADRPTPEEARHRAVGVPVEDEVLGRGDAAHDALVDLLVDGLDARPRGIERARQDDRAAVERDPAGGRLVRAGQELDERGLAGTVRADDAQHLALVKVEVDLHEGTGGTEGHRQAPDRKDRGAVGLRCHAVRWLGLASLRDGQEVGRLELGHSRGELLHVLDAAIAQLRLRDERRPAR